MNVNVIDGTNIYFICWSVLVGKKEDGLVTDLDHNELISLFFMKIKQFMGDKNNIVTFEGKNSRGWRQSIYPEYKAQRKNLHDDPNGEHFYWGLNEVQDLLQYLPCKVIKAEDCEGDDCIFTITEGIMDKYPEATVKIVSSDEDLTQIALLHPDRIKVLHPIKKEYREVNPSIVLYKTVVGDGSDNIKFKKGIGPKTFEKMKEYQETWFKYVKPEEEKRLREIQKIVDLRCYPKDLRQRIVDVYNSTPWNSPNIDKFRERYPDTYLCGFLVRLEMNYNLDMTENLGSLDTVKDYDNVEDIYPEYSKEQLLLG